MDLFAFPPFAFLLDATYRTLMGLSALLSPVAGAASAALAIVIITLFVRAALIPAGIAQARSEQVRTFVLLLADLSEANGMVTPTMKLKRTAFTERTRHIVENL